MRLTTTTATARATTAARRGTAPASRLHVVAFLPKQQQQQQPSASSSNKVIVSSKQQRPPAPAPPPQLMKDEQASLAAARAAAGLSDEASAADISAAALSGVLATIRSGVSKQEQDLAKLEGAMLLAEQLCHATGSCVTEAGGGAAAADPQAVDVWQPIFASAGGFPRLLYIPVPEFFDMHRALPDATAISMTGTLTDSIDVTSSPERAAAAAGPDSGRINVITALGPVTTHFLGTCCWLDDSTFEYAINTVRLDLGGRSFSFGLRGPLQLKNQLRFFLVTVQVACARSKLGGTMLLAPGPPQGRAYFNTW